MTWVNSLTLVENFNNESYRLFWASIPMPSLVGFDNGFGIQRGVLNPYFGIDTALRQILITDIILRQGRR